MTMSNGKNGALTAVKGRVVEVVVERREREERETSCRNKEEEACSELIFVHYHEKFIGKLKPLPSISERYWNQTELSGAKLSTAQLSVILI